MPCKLNSDTVSCSVDWRKKIMGVIFRQVLQLAKVLILFQHWPAFLVTGQLLWPTCSLYTEYSKTLNPCEKFSYIMRNERIYLAGDFHYSNSDTTLTGGIIFSRWEVSIEANFTTSLIDQLHLLLYVKSFLWPTLTIWVDPV